MNHRVNEKYETNLCGSKHYCCAVNSVLKRPPPIEIHPGQMSGIWKATRFYKNKQDRSFILNGYTFQFKFPATVTASFPGGTYDGNWQFRVPGDKTVLSLNFVLTVPLNELNKDWNLIDSSASAIHLYFPGGTLVGSDSLLFEK
ncbi:MAG: hypothetical protein JWN76_1679 [Chitinophagaceae bacterium]|nr:hypothetical protein [Chitinophagaceae bacterium]